VEVAVPPFEYVNTHTFRLVVIGFRRPVTCVCSDPSVGGCVVDEVRHVLDLGISFGKEVLVRIRAAASRLPRCLRRVLSRRWYVSSSVFHSKLAIPPWRFSDGQDGCSSNTYKIHQETPGGGLVRTRTPCQKYGIAMIRKPRGRIRCTIASSAVYGLDCSEQAPGSYPALSKQEGQANALGSVLDACGLKPCVEDVTLDQKSDNRSECQGNVQVC